MKQWSNATIRRKPIRFVAVLLFGLMLGTSPASAQNAPEYRIVWDDFENGFTADAPGAKWFRFSFSGGGGTYVANDGRARTRNGILGVRARGTNPTTNKPAFINTMAQEDDNAFGLPGQLDHFKWFAFMNHKASTGEFGFDAVVGKELSCETEIRGKTFGTANHPFGAAVANAGDDLRLANTGMSVVDFQTWMVFEFRMTNQGLYAVYGRLPYGRTSGDNYAAFLHAIRIQPRTARDWHALKISYNRARGVVRWFVDGVRVRRVDQIGHRLGRATLTLDHGGTEQTIEMKQLDCGMGMFTLLDGDRPTNQGLVRLSNRPYFYFDPDAGEPTLETFVDGSSTDSSRLFGQGARLFVRHYVVASRRAQ